MEDKRMEERSGKKIRVSELDPKKAYWVSVSAESASEAGEIAQSVSDLLRKAGVSNFIIVPEIQGKPVAEIGERELDVGKPVR